jgi:hypothetical protein
MSIRIVPAILAAAVSVAFGFPPANAQPPRGPQPPQSLRLYVLDSGRITPANVDAYGLKPSEMAKTNMRQISDVGRLQTARGRVPKNGSRVAVRGDCSLRLADERAKSLRWAAVFGARFVG